MSKKPASENRRPTLQDVAHEAGVSLSTVDRVFNLRTTVRADTARRIAEAAARLGFHAVGVIERHLHTERPRRRFGFLLQRQDAVFYQGLARALSDAALRNVEVQAQVLIEYLDNLDPMSAARHLLALGEQVDAVAIVATDHPQVHASIATLRAKGVPVVALISDLAAPARAGYVGLDNRRVGRTAAWFISQIAKQPGAVAVIVGSYRFQCQELCEMSFRSYLRDLPGDWEVLAPRMTLENESFAYEGTLDLLRERPDLAGLYLAGGGTQGVLQALRVARTQGLHTPVVVCHDLTPITRLALQDGIAHAVLSHPLSQMAENSVQLMLEALTLFSRDEAPASVTDTTQRLVQRWVPLQIDTPENI